MGDNTDSSREQSREPEAKEGKSEEIFEVEKILDHKIQNKKFVLQVRWVGYDETEDTWEPEEDLQECAKEVVREYYEQLGVQNKAELLKKMKTETPKQQKATPSKAKKRERSPTPSSAEEASDAESDNSYSKKTQTKGKKQRPNNKASSSSASSRVPTKAAVKDYGQSTPAKASGTPSVPKAKAQERRHAMWDSSDDDDEEEHAEVSEFDKIANKVKPNAEVVKAPVKTPAPVEVPTPKAAVVEAPKQKARSPDRESLQKEIPPAVRTSAKNAKTTSVEVNGREKHAATSSNKQKEAWTVDGIAKCTDNGSDEKLILVTSSAGERKVLNPEDAFKLCGWSLTEYLLHHCEF